MIVYLAQDILPFVMYCVHGESGSSLLIEFTDCMIYIMFLPCCFSAPYILYSNFVYLVLDFIRFVIPTSFNKCAPKMYCGGIFLF